MEPLLQVQGLHTYYGSSHVLFGLGLEVRKGEVVVLLGRNGAGKTTTLKSIMGVIAFQDGHVRLSGRDIGGLESDEICRAGLGYVPEDCRIFRGLSVAENLETARRPARSGSGGWDEERVFELFPALRSYYRRRGDALSGGQQRMLAIARTLMGNPELLLLDEPSEGLAPIVIDQMLANLRVLKNKGQTILLSEQNLRFALELADRAYIIEKGEIKYEGAPAELAADDTVRKAYLSV
jgi:branched-chain amino acid transport system ATP-binding protein